MRFAEKTNEHHWATSAKCLRNLFPRLPPTMCRCVRWHHYLTWQNRISIDKIIDVQRLFMETTVCLIDPINFVGPGWLAKYACVVFHLNNNLFSCEIIQLTLSFIWPYAGTYCMVFSIWMRCRWWAEKHSICGDACVVRNRSMVVIESVKERNGSMSRIAEKISREQMYELIHFILNVMTCRDVLTCIFYCIIRLRPRSWCNAKRTTKRAQNWWQKCGPHIARGIVVKTRMCEKKCVSHFEWCDCGILWLVAPTIATVIAIDTRPSVCP